MTSTKHYYAKIIRLGLPILVSQVGIIATAFADNVMVGRYSTDALASASFVNNVFNTAMFACMGFTYGLTPLIGALFPSRNYQGIGTLLRNGLLINTLFALLVSVVMGILWLNIGSLGQPPELHDSIRSYYLIILGCMLPTALFNVFAQWLFAINNTKLPMWIMLGANALNILGNYTLIFGHFGLPEMGLDGAGWSTLGARIAGLIAVVAFFCCNRRFRPYREGLRRAVFNRLTFRKVGRTSWPVSLQMAFESASFSIAALMAGWLGTISLAAFQIIVIVGTLGFCIYYSMGASVSVLVSNAAGTDDRHAMRRIGWEGYHVILTLAAISSAIFALLGSRLIGLFTEDPEVIHATVALILPLVAYQLGDATQINFANALRGTSHVMPMLWIAFLSYVIVGIPATYILGFTAHLGVWGIILSFSVSLFMAGALFLRFFLKATRP